MMSPTWWFLERRQCFLFLHFVSFAFLYIPNSIGWYFGNLAVYLNSYWYAKLDTSNFYSTWVISVYIIAWSGSVIAAGSIIKKIDRRVLTFIGVLLFDVGFFASYFSMQVSQTLFILTLGGMSGVGFGFIQSEALTRIPTLIAKRTGLAFAVLNNFTNIGAMMLQWLITRYVNPLNMKAANLVLGHFEVFSQKAVIERVPGVFIVLGIVTCFCHWTGLILTVLLKDRGTISKSDKGALLKKCKDGVVLHKSESLKQNITCYNEAEMNQVDERNQANSTAMIENRRTSYRTIYMEQPARDISESQRVPHSATKAEAGVAENIYESTEDLSPWQMLRTMTFYTVWFTIFANDTTYVVTLNFYKIFGQLWIQDDHFLTQVGIASLCVVILMRILLGLAVDRYGVKTTQVLLSTSMSLTLAIYYFTPQITRWLFAVCTCIILGLCSSVYICLPVMILELFGQTDFASKYGIVATATVVLNIIAPPTFKALLNLFDWSAIFLCSSAVNTLALVFNVLGLPGGP